MLTAAVTYYFTQIQHSTLDIHWTPTLLFEFVTAGCEFDFTFADVRQQSTHNRSEPSKREMTRELRAEWVSVDCFITVL